MNRAYLLLLRNGDERSWHQLLEQFHRLVVWVVAQRGVPRRDIDDVAADAWLKAFARFSSFSADDIGEAAIEKVFKAWLATIAVNTAKDYFRKRREVLGDTEAFDDLSSEEESDSLDWYLPSSLTEQEVEVVYLKRDGHTFKEIAASTNSSLSSAYQIYRDALRKINEAN